jgi:hydroxypyruvate reductase
MSIDPVHAPRAFLRALFDAAVARAQPSRIVAMHLPHPPKGRTLVLGAGKAAASMAAAVEAAWPSDAPLGGLVITRYGHAHEGCARIEVVEAGHPVPDAQGLAAAHRLFALTRGLTEDDLVLCLFSGGGSALMPMPVDGLSLEDKRAVHRALLASGASIDEMNCVRKHLSGIKGGRLGIACAPARVVSLLLSDVPGDAPDVIASGPTVPDTTTCAEALAVLARYGIDIPPGAYHGLTSGAYETPKPDDARFAGHETRVVATARDSLLAAAEFARVHGVAAHVLADDVEGESREVGKVHAALARSVARRGEPFARPCLLLSGGETTVTVRNQGARGGRATEFLLGTALALAGEPGVHVLAADTDGIDGSEENAGAFVGPDTLARAEARGISARAALEANDAYTFFAALGDLLVTGPTRTNVNDFRALLIL